MSTFPQHPMFLQKLGIEESFDNCGFNCRRLSTKEDVVRYDGVAICRDRCLTPEGLTMAQRLLPGHTGTMRQKHEAASWLAYAAATVRRQQLAAVEVAEKEMVAAMGELPAKISGGFRALLGLETREAQSRAIEALYEWARARSDQTDAWRAGLRRALL